MLRIEKKMDRSNRLLRKIASVAAALVVAGIFIALCGYNPFQVYQAILTGSFSTAYYRGQTIVKMIPLVMMGLGVAICFKMKFFNIGSEGQFYMGAMGATWAALFTGDLPIWLKWVLMFVAAFVMGGLWCFIAGWLKAKWRVSDTLITLMLNYVAIKLISYLQYSAWKDPKSFGFPKIANFPEALWLPKVLDVQCGWIIALFLAGLIYVLFKRMKLGYEIAVMGDAESTARYAGMDTKRILLLVSLIGGGLCGLAGMLRAAGNDHTLHEAMSGGLGYTAIVVAYMANMHPFGIILVSFLFAVLLQGSAYMQILMQIPTSAADVVQGIILVFVLGSEFFSQYRFVRVSRRKEAA